jgi:hypothetical protein
LGMSATRITTGKATTDLAESGMGPRESSDRVGVGERELRALRAAPARTTTGHRFGRRDHGGNGASAVLAAVGAGHRPRVGR